MNNLKISKPMIKDQVYTTSDYFMFKLIDGNRNINNLHIDRLKKSISENYLFTVIIVNEKYEIIDGQHRFMVLKELKLPINYIICDGYGLDEVHRLNMNSKNWQSDDYLEGYCNLGYPDYIKYREFKNKYGFGHHETMALLTGISHSPTDDIIKKFWSGKMKIKDFNNAERIAELICLVKPFYDGYKRRYFIFAILQLLKKDSFDFTEFLQKLKLQPTAMVDCTSTSQYISLIEEIYNYKRKVKVNLRY